MADPFAPSASPFDRPTTTPTPVGVSHPAPIAPSIAPPTAPVPGEGGNPLDQLGHALFGQGSGSAFGGVPVIGDLGRFVGEAGSNLAGLAIKPIEVAATVVSHTPTGWLPGGADEKFRQLGEIQRLQDPDAYEQWKIADADAGADFLFGGNIKADYTREWVTEYLDRTKEGPQGLFSLDPGLGASPAGSLGGGIADALHLMFLPGLSLQRGIAGAGEDASKGDLSRIGKIITRRDEGYELNEVEKTILQHLDDGSWSRDHALNYLTRSNQGLSREFLPQLIAGAVLDPTMWAMGGASAAVKAGQAGERAARVLATGERAASEFTRLENAQMALRSVQASPALSPVFRVGRSIVDPFSLLTKTTAERGLVDLTMGASTKALDSIYSPGAVSSAWKLAEKYGVSTEFGSALGTYSANLARKFTTINHRATMLMDSAGEKLFDVLPDGVVDTLMRVGDNDVVRRIGDYGYALRKVFRNEADSEQLAKRMAAAFGRSLDETTADVARMSQEERSLWHATTYGQTWNLFGRALAKVGETRGNVNVEDMVILNDNQLDAMAADELFTAIGKAKGAANKAEVWNAAADRFGDIADIGRGDPHSAIRMTELREKLRNLIDDGHLHTRATPEELADPGLLPLRDFLDAHNIDGEQLWHIGFAPAEHLRWGMIRDHATGLLRPGWDPFVSNVMDATPAYRPVNDVARNFLGQIIGPAPAGAIARPIEAVEVAIKTASDVISGRRLIENMRQRFVVNMAKLDMPQRDATRLFDIARDVTQADRTTIQGMHPENTWKAVESKIPMDLRQTVTRREFTDALLDAAGGDMRIIGLTSGFSQRMRSMIEARFGVGGVNFAGQLTVNAYRQLRYSLSPSFFIQRITDGAYFNILDGIHPVGGGVLKEGSDLWRINQIIDKIGDTSLGRNFAMDMPEFQIRSNFQEGLRSRLNQLAGNRLENVAASGERWQRNNMLRNIHSRLGRVVRESLDESKTAMQKLADEATGVEKELYESAIKGFDDFDVMLAYYSKGGRLLTDEEAGLRYIEEMFSDELAKTVTPTGIVTFKDYIKKGTYHKPHDIGELQAMPFDEVAIDLGYENAAALRRAVGPEGERSVGWLKERLLRDYNAAPEFVNRFAGSLTFNHGEFWRTTQEAMKLTPRQTFDLQNVLAGEAVLRGMEPADYLSQVLRTNLGDASINDHFASLLRVLTNDVAGTPAQQVAELVPIWMRTLDLSAQRRLMVAFRQTDGAGVSREVGDMVARRAAGKQVIVPDVDSLAKTVDEYVAKRPPMARARKLTLPDTGEAVGTTKDYIGPGVRAVEGVEPEVASALVNELDRLNAIAGDSVVHFDIGDLQQLDPIGMQGGTAAGETFRAGADKSAIILDREGFVGDIRANWDYAIEQDAINSQRQTFSDWSFIGDEAVKKGLPRPQVPRKSNFGAPYEVDPTMLGVLRHEYGHGLFHTINKAKRTPEIKALRSFFDRFDESPAARQMSESATMNMDEAASEVIALALHPDPDWTRFAAKPKPGAFDDLPPLSDTEYWKDVRPDLRPGGVEGAPQTAQEAVEELRSLLIDAKLLRGVPTLDDDVTSILNNFRAWTEKLGEARFKGTGSGSRIGELAATLSQRIPKAPSLAYNRSEALIEELIKSKLHLAQQDAFMLAEMSTKRTMAGRTLNHPVFGMYPTSYMWGKVFPQMIRYLAKEPFGYQGAELGYQIARVQAQLGIQRELDPDFATMENTLSESEVAFGADYLTPSLPWSDFSSRVAPWLRSIGKDGIDIGKMWQAELNTIDPQRWFMGIAEPISEIADFAQNLEFKSPEERQLEQRVSQPQATPTPAQGGPESQLEDELTDALTQLNTLFQ